MSYDENAELTRYIRRYHSDLYTRFEYQVEQAEYARSNFADDSSEEGKRLMARYGQAGDARFDDALAEGLQAFRMRVARRILAEHSDLQINRCPRCNCIVRTPDAKQCFWCGYDWHGAKG
jgi:hypothetical protein